MLNISSYEMVKKVSNYSGRQEKYYSVTCPDCGEIHLVNYRNMKLNKSERCRFCSTKKTATMVNKIGYRKLKIGSDSHLYKSGYTKRPDGYNVVSLHGAHPYRKMADKHGRIREHRLIMAQHLGRDLYPWEIIHHKNGIRDDNRVKNLEIMNNNYTHDIITKLMIENKRLMEELCQLKAKNKGV